MAAANGHKELVTLLISQGSDINEKDEVYSSILSKLDERGERIKFISILLNTDRVEEN